MGGGGGGGGGIVEGGLLLYEKLSNRNQLKGMHLKNTWHGRTFYIINTFPLCGRHSVGEEKQKNKWEKRGGEGSGLLGSGGGCTIF